ncbi:hypothetical protein B0T10DRAFT_401584 [Thelonectria olida]|uniref:cyclin-dependent kinase n=1 Tax=Thelonectria olida TaxID=1576542 RepID=A0A9P9ARJ8_9HYPO|nr:hypothetical protein B0T10DRAFT_401584 [Thelonectria olida]
MKNQPKSQSKSTYQSKRSRRPRHALAAMKDDQGRDEKGDRARTERGLKLSSRQESPREPRHGSDARAHHRHSSKPEPSSHRRRHSRDRSRDRDRDRDRDHDRPHSSDPSRRQADPDDLIPRYRASRDRHRESDDKPRRRSRSRSRSPARAVRDSPSATKRHRSRSPSVTTSHRKRSRRDRSPRGRTRDYSPESASRRHGRHSSRDRRKSSPRRHVRSPKSPSGIEDSQARPARRSRSRSRSQTKGDTGSRRADRESRSEKPRHRSRSRSVASEKRRPSSRRVRPPSRGEYPEASSTATRDRPSDLEHRSSQRQLPPRSPKAHRDRRSRDRSPSQRLSSRSDVDEMASRGAPRGGYNPKYSHKQHHGGESQGYTQSPQPGGSYQTSPSQSPYGANRAGWNNNQQYSPQQQYPPQGGNYGPPNGPSGHYHSNPPHSPSHSNNGPPQQYPQGNYRGGYRGGFRGGSSQGRGGPRGGFKNAQWSSGNQGPRGHYDDAPNGRTNPLAQDDGGDANPDAMDTEPDQFRSPTKQQAEDGNNEGNEENAMTTPKRQPPSGPGSQSQPGSSGKFSFAFKPSSKPTAATPKPEISSKLSAAPRREPLKNDRDRQPPRSAPTEPASARSRHDLRNAPDGPRVAPRMRKVKKILKRPKPRPTLAADLVDSESVFFRKPGNESVVGSGTYGKVFKGLNVYTKGLVALKRIRMEGERDGFPVTAVREIKLLQSLRHVNIVNLQEVMVEKNDCFMVFEYMSHDLTGLLNHPSFKLDAAQKKHLAKQLFEGLDYLHTRGVLHRDIKAANILVSNEGILKLADFGLARFYAKRHQLDYTNRVITIWYRSPELLLGETKYTAAVDVWSAACVMVEIFTRNAIFPGDGTELSQIEKIYNLMGTPNLQDWPDLINMAWFELLRPTAKRKNMFADKYRERVTPAAFELLSAMFRYDPAKRPNAAEVLQHAYFTKEEPKSRQAIELAAIDGEWHEFESKALRKENERRDREARRAAKDKDNDKKRGSEINDQQRDAKRVQVDKNQTTKSTTATTKA